MGVGFLLRRLLALHLCRFFRIPLGSHSVAESLASGLQRPPNQATTPSFPSCRIHVTSDQSTGDCLSLAIATNLIVMSLLARTPVTAALLRHVSVMCPPQMRHVARMGSSGANEATLREVSQVQATLVRGFSRLCPHSLQTLLLGSSDIALAFLGGTLHAA